MPLFTGRYSWPLTDVPDPVMQGALTTAHAAQLAVGAPNAQRIALMVVELGPSTTKGGTVGRGSASTRSTTPRVC